MTLATSQQEFSDADFRVVDNGDQSKKLAFQISGVTTGTTRTWTVPDANDTFVGTSRTISAGGIATGGGDLSANRTITVTAATASDQETGTSTTVAVVPGVQHRHLSAAKVHVSWDNAGSIVTSYNVTSVTDTGVGNWTPNFTTSFSSAFYAAFASGGYAGPVLIYSLASKAAGSIQVIAWSSAAVKTDPTTSHNHLVCYGDQ